MSRVVVTGGAGYIGSHAVRALAEAGHAVAVLDDLSAGHVESLPPGVPLVRAAIHDHDAVRRLLVEHRADAVMHFAAWLKVGESVEKPVEYYQNNVVGTLAVLGGDARRRREALHLLVDVRGLRRARVGPDRRDAGHETDQRLRRVEARLSSARCRISSAPTG